MNWQMALALNILTFTASIFLLKTIVVRLPRIQAFFWHFLLCAFLAWGYWAIIDRSRFFLSDFIFIAAIGFVNGFGAYFQWKAIKINLTKTTLLQPLGEVLAILLAAIFLHEVEKWNALFLAGIILCFAAVWLFALKGKKRANQLKDNKIWLICIAGMILIFGINTFFIKITALGKIDTASFLASWYTGLFLSAALILAVKKESPFSKMIIKPMAIIPISSIAFLLQQATLFLALRLALASQILPMRLVGITFLPIVIGWFLFKEWQELKAQDMLAFLCGFCGLLMIAFS